jgi:2-polyprenyl-3-methyl-5-hydroxy-6-metoxy-1,4-benzoquinol methylase
MRDRTASYGQDDEGRLSRLGRWNMRRSVRHRVGALEGVRLGDFGCGYEARFVRDVLTDVASATVIDVALDPALREEPKVTGLEGELPGVAGKVETASLDVVLCISVLEHLADDTGLLAECHRVLAPGGRLMVHVPSWRGKRLLEPAAFRLGVAPAEEMNDHKRYYDPRDLWPKARAAGFQPHAMRCFHHQLGCSTMLIARR